MHSQTSKKKLKLLQNQQNFIFLVVFHSISYGSLLFFRLYLVARETNRTLNFLLCQNKTMKKKVVFFQKKKEKQQPVRNFQKTEKALVLLFFLFLVLFLSKSTRKWTITQSW